MKRIKKYLSFSAIALVIGSMAIAPIYANTVDGQDKQGSKATIKFLKPETEEPVKPVDPDEDKPGDPEGGTGSTGDLTIDYVPNLTFPDTEIKNSLQTITSKNVKPFVQVSDRRATGKGWDLTASLGEFKVIGDDTKKITEGKITLSNGQAFKADPASNSKAPTVADPIVLTINGEAKSIMTAAEGAGLGTWSATWISDNTLNENVVLEVNTGSTVEGEYVADVTWLLAQQP